MRDLRKIIILLAIALLCAGAAFSQAVNGTIVGTVTDASGASVANAKVTVTETQTRIAHTRQTNEAGTYEFVNMPPGIYEVSVEMAGFKKEVQSGLVLEANTS